ncbi:hypothetical protein VNI00_018920, partial [Paramarasmius palmivorus]
MFNAAALVGRDWTPRSRFWVAQAVLTILDASRARALRDLLATFPLPSTFLDVARQFHINLHSGRDVRNVRPYFFHPRGDVAQQNHRLKEYGRSVNSFVGNIGLVR